MFLGLMKRWKNMHDSKRRFNVYI